MDALKTGAVLLNSLIGPNENSLFWFRLLRPLRARNGCAAAARTPLHLTKSCDPPQNSLYFSLLPGNAAKNGGIRPISELPLSECAKRRQAVSELQFERGCWPSREERSHDRADPRRQPQLDRSRDP
jgi:hypothetical protein